MNMMMKNSQKSCLSNRKDRWSNSPTELGWIWIPGWTLGLTLRSSLAGVSPLEAL